MAPSITQRPIQQNAHQNVIRDPFFVVPHQETYAGLYNVVNQSYYTYFDQALLDSQENSLAMRRDCFVHELIRHRQTPVICLPYHVVVDDPDDPRQKSVGDTLDGIVRDVPRIKHLMLVLLEAIFYGKYGSQFSLGPRKVAGNRWNSVTNHIPINGDKLRYKWDGTPVPSYRAEGLDQQRKRLLNAYSDCIEYTMLGAALFLKQSFLRDRFIIHKFEPFDTDYLFELEEQLSVHGLGLRSRLYWAWNLRTELLSWMINALQRVGANGMIYGFYEEGNDAMKTAVIEALRQLAQDNYSVFPVKGGTPGQDAAKGTLGRFEPAQQGYDILFQLIQHLEGIMRRATLGQDLSSVAKPTGIGAGAAQLQGDVRADYIEYDAMLLAETLTEQLLGVILKYNKFIYDGREYYGSDLPFSCRLEFQLTRDNVAGAIQAAQQLFQMGVELDADDLRRKAGRAPPHRKESTVANPQHQQQKQQAGGMQQAAGRLGGFADKIQKHAKKEFSSRSNGRHHDRLARIR
jgi:hypothetical protein